MASARYGNVCALLVALVGLSYGKPAAGSYLRDVELIAPSPRAEFNTVYYYPSYVKGEDPVEEFNRRRLHVDTAMFMDEDAPRTDRYSETTPPNAVPHREQYAQVKRKRKAFASLGMRPPKLRARQSEYERDYLKIRQSSGVPRYVRDDVEIFDIDRNNRIKKSDPIRKTRAVPRVHPVDRPRRYEESDPHIFAYGRADIPDPDSSRAASPHPDRPDDRQYFQDTFQFQKSPLELEFGHLFESNDGWEERYAEVFGDGSYRASSRRGNDQHYIEQLERGSHGAGVFQKKVKWADKQGGFGEHYWDLNHIQPAAVHHG